MDIRIPTRIVRSAHTRRQAFTLVELLVVIAIIGMLVALLLPAVQAAREAARRTQCAGNLRQLAVAMQMYQDANKILPPAGPRAITSTEEHFYTSGFVCILPFHEEQAIYDQWNFKAWAITGSNVELTKRPLAIHRCPSMILEIHGDTSPGGYCADKAPPTSYALSTGTHYRGREVWYASKDPRNVYSHNGAFVLYGKGHYRVGLDDISAADGTSSTVLLGELGFGLVNWGDGCYRGGGTHWGAAYPGVALASTGGVFNATFESGRETDTFKGEHPNGVYLAFCDGSVRFIDEMIDAQTLNALATRDGGESMEGF